MNQVQWLKLHKELCEKMMRITEAKNSDYNKGTEDAFSNFKMVEQLNIASTETGFLTRMTDKLSRINALVGGSQGQKVKDEAVEDTLLDLANYCLLFIGYLQSSKQYSNSIKAKYALLNAGGDYWTIGESSDDKGSTVEKERSECDFSENVRNGAALCASADIEYLVAMLDELDARRHHQ